MENTTKLQRKRGPAPSGLHTAQYTVMLEVETAEWAKSQPGGLSEMVRRHLREAFQASRKPVAAATKD